MAGLIGRAAGGQGKPTDGRVLARLAGLAALVVVGAGGHAAWEFGRTVSMFGRNTTPADLSASWTEIWNALGVGGLMVLVGLVASRILGQRDRRERVRP